MKHLKYSVNIILLLVLVVSLVSDKAQATQFSDKFVVGMNSYAPGDEIIEKRTENSKTTYLGGNKFALDVSIGAIHYKDNYVSATEQWKDIDLTPFNGVVTKAPYTLVVDGAKVTMTDKKTGSITVLELTDTGNKKLVKPSLSVAKGKAEKKNIDTDTDLEITWENTRVKVTRVLKSDKAPKSAKFNLSQIGTGIKIDYQAQDASPDRSKKIKVDTILVGGVLTETIDTTGVIYPIRVDPTLDLKSSVGTDDADVFTPAGGINLIDSHHTMGQGVAQTFDAGIRYIDVSIPNGSAITTSYITFVAWSDASGVPVNLEIRAEQGWGVHTFSTYADFVARAYTTQVAYWTIPFSWSNGVSYNTPSINAIVQELVNDYGGLASASIAFFVLDAGNAAGANRTFVPYESNPLISPSLHIEYLVTCLTSTLAADTPTYSGATHNATLNGVLTGTVAPSFRGFAWSTTSNTTNPLTRVPPASYTDNWTESSGVIGAFSHNIGGLVGGTTYYYRAYSRSTIGVWAWGDEMSFITLRPPSIITLPVTNISRNTARFNSLVSDTGGSVSASVRFLRGTTTGTYSVNSTAVAGYVAGDNPYIDVTGLVAGTTYYVRAEITACGTTLGSEESFTTSTSISAPTSLSAIPASTSVSLSWIKGIGSDSTVVRYNIGIYPTSNITGTLGYSGTEVSTIVTGLSPGTSYYFMAWGVTSAVYSTSNATVMATTLAGSATPAIMPTPATPNNWFQAPDYTNMSNTPFYSIVNFAADAFEVPKSTLWYMCALFFCVAVGVFFYSTVGNANLFLSVCAVGAMMLACSLMKLVPYWHILPFAVFAAVGIFVGERR
jgi:hypothetical protein